MAPWAYSSSLAWTDTRYKRVFFDQNLAFLQSLPSKSSGKQLNSKTALYASNNLKIQAI